MRKFLLSYLRGACLVLMMLLCSSSLWAQQKISGTVIASDDKLPVIGASVKVKGKSISTVTNDKGEFSLPAQIGDVLEFSYIGYVKQTVELKTNSPLNITLAADKKQLNEVVVTALGVKKESKKLGYAVQEVKGEDLIKARDANPVTGLIGKVAGLSVGPSAEMLRKPTVLLRGNEITLYVVDGIPINSDTWNISPDDIASYTVLKGPTAASIYGNRALNGAILITTKKGSKSDRGFTVELNSSTLFDKGFVAFPRLQNDYGPGENGIYSFVDGKGGGKNDNDYDIWGPKFEGQLIPQYDSPVDPITGVRSGTPWIARGKDNLKKFLQTGIQSTNNISLGAVGDRYNMRFSASNSYQQSIIPNMSLNITNFNMYGSYDISPKLKIEANINYNKQYSPNYPDVDYGPNSLIYNTAIWTGADWNVDDMKNYWKPGKEGLESVFAEYQRYHNPWFMVKEWLREHNKNDMYGYVSLNYKINDNLNVTGRTQVTTYSLFRNEKMPFSAHPYGREAAMGDYREDRRNLFENNTEVILNFKKSITNDIRISGLVGGNMRNSSFNSSFASTDYLNVPNVYNFANSLNPVRVSGYTSDLRVLSAYYSFDLDLGKYLTVSNSLRVDKTSALPVKNNTFSYPSVSLSTVLTDYLKFPEFISFFKLRGSFASIKGGGTTSLIGTTPGVDFPIGYGQNYNSPYEGPTYELNTPFNTSKPYNNQTAAYAPTKIIDPNIKPFSRSNYEAGMDVKFLKDYITFNATYFNYIDGPQIYNNKIDPATGFSTYVFNAVKTSKKGLELTLSGSPIRNPKGFNWDVLVNWSTYTERFLELPNGVDVINRFFRKGDRVDKFYGGNVLVKDNQGNVILDAAGKPTFNPVPQYLGNLDADWTFSIGNKFSYKNFNFGFQFDGSIGGVMTDYLHNKTMRGGHNIETVQGAFGDARYQDYLNATNKNYTGVYVGQGVMITNNVPINFDQNTGAIINYDQLKFATNTTPVLVQDYISKYYNADDANLMSKTYVKLREITLGYTLPTKLLEKSFIKRASISFVARNVLYFVKDSRFKDVDIDQYNDRTTSTGLQSPTTRRYGVNINMAF